MYVSGGLRFSAEIFLMNRMNLILESRALVSPNWFSGMTGLNCSIDHLALPPDFLLLRPEGRGGGKAALTLFFFFFFLSDPEE